MMRANPKVCVEIDRVEHLGSWRSVIAQGHAQLLEGDDAYEAARILAARLTTLIDDPASRGRLEEAHSARQGFYVVRITLREQTGRVEGAIRP